MKLKRLLALVLCFAMVLGTMSFNAFADESAIDSEQALKAALSAGGEVVLGADIELTETLEISTDAVINLNGFALEGALDTLIKTTAGNIVITGGTIKNVRDNATTTLTSVYLTGDSVAEIKDVTIETTGTGIYLDENAKITELNATVKSYVDVNGYCVYDAVSVNGNARINVISGGEYTSIYSEKFIETWNETHSYSATMSYPIRVNSTGASIGEIQGGTFIGQADKGNMGATIYVNSGNIGTISGGYFGFNKVGITAQHPTKMIFANSGNYGFIGAITGGTFEKGTLGFGCDFEGIVEESGASIKDTGETVNVKTYYSSQDKTDTLNVLEVYTPVPVLSGKGTKAEPYIVDSPKALADFRDDVNAGNSYEGKYIKLTDDIDLTSVARAAAEWTPVGNGARSSKTYTGNAFKGTFDGDNHTITGVNITSSASADAAVGLFGVVDGGTVKNLNLTDVNINVPASDLAGGAIGMMLNNATADSISVSGVVAGDDGVGGIAGRMIISGTISNCTNNASVTATTGGIGGIVGKAYYEDGENTALFASVTNCTNNGTITSPSYIGGIVGLARANVSGCINNGAVVGGTQTGGIAGQIIAAGTVSGNENNAKISGTSHLGGIVGDYTQTSAYTYNNVAIKDNTNNGELVATGDYAAILGCNNIDGFTDMVASGNVSYYYTEGLELFGNPEDMVIDDTNRFIKVVAKIGDDKYETFSAAVSAAKSGDTITMLSDVTLSELTTLPAGIKLNGNGKFIDGEVWAGGNLTFEGHTKIAVFNAGYNKPTITIGEGATLETTSGRMVVGHGATFNITGSITDAKTADVSTLTPSLIIPGASFTGVGVNFNVTNAYIKATYYCSTSKSASGTFNFNITNSIWGQDNKLAFEAASTAATVNFNLKDSVLTTTGHLVFGVVSGNSVIDNSNVNVGVYRQLENRSNLTIKNGSVVYATVNTNENSKNPGKLTVDNAKFISKGEFSGAELGTGTLILKIDAKFTTGTLAKVNVTIDATSELAATKADMDTTAITVDTTGVKSAVKVIDLSSQGSSIESIVTLSDENIEAIYGDDGDVTIYNPAVWDGTTIDTSWYNTTDTEFVIETAAQLAGFAAIANGTADGIAIDTFEGKTIKLGANIDLNNQPWAPIGGRTSPTLSGQIEGTFDGQGYTISNLKVTKGAEYEAVNMNIGLFGITRTGKFTAKNFTLENVDIYGSASVAAVLGRTVNCKAVIDNVDVIGDIKIEASTQNVAAICAQGYMPVITNCSVKGNDGSYIKAGTAQVGGIAGWTGESSNATTIQNCSVENVTISGEAYVGAIAAIIQYGATVKDNTAKDVNLTGITDEYHYGTIIGSLGAGYVSGNKYTAPVYISGNSAENVSVAVSGSSVAEPVDFGAHYDTQSYATAKIGDAYFESFEGALDYAKSKSMTEVEIGILGDVAYSSKIADFKKITLTGTDRKQTFDLNVNSPIEINTELVFNDLTVSRLDTNWLYNYTYIKGGLAFNDCKMIGSFNVTAQSTDFIGCDFYNDDTFGDGNYSIWLYNCFDGIEVNITDCTFDVYERAIKMYGDGYTGAMNLNISESEFVSRTADKTVVEMAYANTTGIGAMKLNIDNSTKTGFGAPEHIDGETNAWFNVEDATTGKTRSSVIIDGEVVYSDYTVMIGDTFYENLQAAFDAVQEGDTITLLSDITINENTRYNLNGYYEGAYYEGDKSFIIDLNEHTITQNGSVNDYLLLFKNAGTKANEITFKNGTIDAGTTAFCAVCTSSTSTQQITINLENVEIIGNNSNGSVAKIRGGAVLNVKEGTVITGKDSYLGIENSNSTVNIYDGAEIYMNGTTSYNGILVGVGSNGTINVYGGYGKGAKGAFIAMTSGGTINVYGGEWIANKDGSYANDNKSVLIAQSASGAKSVVNVYGGQFAGGYNCYGDAVGDAQINISGGTFNSNPQQYVAEGFAAKQSPISGLYSVIQNRNLTLVAKGGTADSDGKGIVVKTGDVFAIDVMHAGLEEAAGAKWELIYDSENFTLDSLTTNYKLHTTDKTKPEIFIDNTTGYFRADEPVATYTFTAKTDITANVEDALFTLENAELRDRTESWMELDVTGITSVVDTDVTIELRQFSPVVLVNGEEKLTREYAADGYTVEVKDDTVEGEKVTYYIGGKKITNLTFTEVGTYEITYTMEKVGYKTEEGTFTLTIEEPDYVVEVNFGENSDYVDADTKMVLVYTNNEDITFDYDGVQMFDVSAAGYKYNDSDNYAKVFALVVSSKDASGAYMGDLADYEEYVTVDYKGTSVVIDYSKKNDINLSKTVTWLDVISIYSVLEHDEEAFTDFMAGVIKADTNCDRVANSIDANSVIAEVYPVSNETELTPVN